MCAGVVMREHVRQLLIRAKLSGRRRGATGILALLALLLVTAMPLMTMRQTAYASSIQAGLHQPDGGALAPDGSLYVADEVNHRVVHFPKGSNMPDVQYTTTVNGGLILGAVSGVNVDSAGNLYVADTNNNRIVMYPVGSTTATKVWGQPNFTSNAGGLSATSLYGPDGVDVDSAGNLYVADVLNNRVVMYPSGSTTATKVWGQLDFTSNTAGISATSLYGPYDIAVDSANNLYVADTSNGRVVMYPSGSTTATKVWGQSNFTSGTQNNGGLSATSLNEPIGIAVDSAGNLYVTDTYNNRVVMYPSGSTVATKVWGQPDFVSNTANNGGLSATSLNRPYNVTVDMAGNVYVADFTNNRVLMYPSGATTATKVWGQPDFVSGTPNNGGTAWTTFLVTDCSASSLSDVSSGGLGWAIAQAMAAPGSTALFSCPQTASPNSIAVTSTILLNQTVTIDGTGQNIVFDGQNARTILDIEGAANVTLNDLTLQNGAGSTSGTGDAGGVYIHTTGTVQMAGTVFSGDTATLTTQGSYGGAVYQASGTLHLTNCAFTGNAADVGGALYISGGTATLTNCLVSNNVARYGGGMALWAGSLSVLQSTLAHNSVTSGNGMFGAGGGMIQRGGTLFVANTTMFANTSSGVNAGGGAVEINFGNATIVATTFTGNTSTQAVDNDISNQSATPLPLVDSIAPDGIAGSVVNTGTLVSASFGAAIAHSSAGVEQTVYPLASYTVAGAQVLLSSLSSYGVTTDQFGTPRASTTDVGAYAAALATATSTGVTAVGPIGVNQVFSLSATVTGNTPTGTLTFTANGSPLGTATLVNGTGALPSLSFGTAGTYTIVASYSGDVNNLASSATTTLQVQAASGISLAVTSTDGVTVTLTATLTGVTAAGIIAFQDGATTIGTVVTSGPTATLIIASTAAGSHEFAATFTSGAQTLTAAAVTYVVTTLALTTTINSSQQIVLTATLGYGPTQGTIHFQDGAVDLGTSSLANGSAQIIAPIDITVSHTYTAVYAGTAGYSPSSSPGMFVGPQIQSGIQQVTINGGAITLQTAAIGVPSTKLTGFDQSIPVAFTEQVSDASGSGIGWHLTIAQTPLGAGMISTITGAPAIACVANATCAPAGNTVASYPIVVPTGNVENVYANAAPGTGMGAQTVVLSMAVFVPGNARAGSYTSTVTTSVAVGP